MTPDDGVLAGPYTLAASSRSRRDTRVVMTPGAARTGARDGRRERRCNDKAEPAGLAPAPFRSTGGRSSCLSHDSESVIRRRRGRHRFAPQHRESRSPMPGLRGHRPTDDGSRPSRTFPRPSVVKKRSAPARRPGRECETPRLRVDAGGACGTAPGRRKEAHLTSAALRRSVPCVHVCPAVLPIAFEGRDHRPRQRSRLSFDAPPDDHGRDPARAVPVLAGGVESRARVVWMGEVMVHRVLV